jgi:penicillin-binding protein 1A
VAEQARKLGITTPISTYPAMALGTSPTTLIEMTAAYAGVAAARRPIVPTGLAEPKPAGMIGVVKSAATALAPWPARDPMLQLLQSAVRNGTGSAARLNVPTYGKTGTTQNHRDALFIGFAGDLVVGVWFGNDDNTPMDGVMGGGVPARTWKRFMQRALAKDAPARPASPRADAIGDLIGAVAGPEAEKASDAVGAVVNDAADGEVDPGAVTDAVGKVGDIVEPTPEPQPPQ